MMSAATSRLREALFERGEIAQLHARAMLQQRAEAFLKVRVAHHREGAMGQPVEGAVEARRARRGRWRRGQI